MHKSNLLRSSTVSPASLLCSRVHSKFKRSNNSLNRSNIKTDPRAFTQSLCSSTSMISTVSQVFACSQQTCCFLLTCLFLLSVEITGGEPQRMDEATKLQSLSQSSSPSSGASTYLHQSMVAVQHGNDGGAEYYTDSDISKNSKHLISPHKSVLYSNHSSNGHPQENTASVIASSFRNFDNQQPPSDSDEELGTNSNSQRRKVQSKNCDTAVLKGCLDGLPPMNATGIPSTPQAVETACRIYNSGINCFDNWAKLCLPEKHRQKLKASITGAHEMYTFLCKDARFRADYLKHRVCYKKLSPHWDECSRQFVEGLKRNSRHNYTAFCCVRLEFLTCVKKSSSYSCDRDASSFLMKMAETLVRSTLRTKSNPMNYCIHVHPDNCIPIVEGSGTRSTTSRLLIISFITLFVPRTDFLRNMM